MIIDSNSGQVDYISTLLDLINRFHPNVDTEYDMREFVNLIRDLGVVANPEGMELNLVALEQAFDRHPHQVPNILLGIQNAIYFNVNARDAKIRRSYRGL